MTRATRSRKVQILSGFLAVLMLLASPGAATAGPDEARRLILPFFQLLGFRTTPMIVNADTENVTIRHRCWDNFGILRLDKTFVVPAASVDFLNLDDINDEYGHCEYEVLDGLEISVAAFIEGLFGGQPVKAIVNGQSGMMTNDGGSFWMEDQSRRTFAFVTNPTDSRVAFFVSMLAAGFLLQQFVANLGPRESILFEYPPVPGATSGAVDFSMDRGGIVGWTVLLALLAGIFTLQAIEFAGQDDGYVPLQ